MLMAARNGPLLKIILSYYILTTFLEHNKKLFFRSTIIRLKKQVEVDRALVALPDFKSGVPGEQPGGWVRFPCTSARIISP